MWTKKDFEFVKKPRFWIPQLIAIILAFVGGFFGGSYYNIHFGDDNDSISTNISNCMINATDSVQSINQQGGITAKSVSIESQRRVLTTDVIAEMSQYLPATKNTRIIIDSIMGDSEAFQFAHEIKTYLQKEGWNVEGVSQASYTSPIIGISVRSIENATLFTVGSKP